MKRRRATRGERRAVVIYVAFVMALSCRPGHPWDGIMGGGVALVVLAKWLGIGRSGSLKQIKERPQEEDRTA
jgi:hypothetical protein